MAKEMEKEKSIIILFEGEYLNDKRWNGKGYDPFNKLIYEIKNGKGLIKEYDKYDNSGRVVFEGVIFKWKKKWKRKRI